MIRLDVMNAADAVKELHDMGLHISADMLRAGIDQKVFPFGNIIVSKNENPRCIVYRKKMLEWAAEHGFEE